MPPEQGKHQALDLGTSKRYDDSHQREHRGRGSPLQKRNPRKPAATVALVTALCLLGDSMLYIVLPIDYPEAQGRSSVTGSWAFPTVCP